MKTNYLLSFSLVLALYVPASQAEQIYKGLDSKGNVQYSDHPFENSQAIELKTPPTYHPADNTLNPNVDNNPNTNPTEAINYKISILSPTDKETFPHAINQIPVQLSLKPDLTPDDQILILLNNQSYGLYESIDGIILSSLPRGAYTLRAQIVSINDPNKIKAESGPVVFYQQRATIH